MLWNPQVQKLRKPAVLTPILRMAVLKLLDWVYLLRRGFNLSIQTTTRIGQNLSGHLHTFWISFVGNVMEIFDAKSEYTDIPRSLLVNKDETAVYFDAKSSFPVNPQGATAVRIRTSGRSCNSMTVCCSVAAYGTKLLKFVILKGTPGGHI